MANPVVLTNATIWLGGYDLSGNSNEVNFTTSRQENPDSRLGDTVEAVYPGPMSVGAEVKGHWDSTLDGPQFTQLTNPSEAWPLTICPDGADDSELAYGLHAYSFNYSAIEATWGDLLPYRLSAKSKSGGSLGRGTVMFPKTLSVSSVSGTRFQLGALTSAQKLIAAFHVFAIDSSNWTLRVYSDVDAVAGGETQRAISSSITTAPNHVVLEVAGPVTDTYWYAGLVKGSGTSITVSAAFAIVDA